MKRTAKSTSYEKSESKLDRLLLDKEFRDLWRFEYSMRHAHKVALRSGIEEYCYQAFDRLLELLDVHETLSNNNAEVTCQLLTFTYGLVYALHKKTHSDGLFDLRAELRLPQSNNVLKSLGSRDLELVEELHKLTYKYGFLILDLWLWKTDMESLAREFIKSYPDQPEVSLPIPQFTFPKKGKHLDGIQIEVPPCKIPVQNTWNLAIYFGREEKMSRIRKGLGDIWSIEGEQALGDDKDYQLALYIDRASCTKSHAMSVLELQVERLKLYKLDPHDDFISNPAASYIDQIRLEEAMLSRSWSSSKDNIRRAVGLYLWDQINDPHSNIVSRKAAIKECIKLLESINPGSLEVYFSNFNKFASADKMHKFGDLEKHFQTVVREMEADYDLTELCIEKADYHSPQDVKRKE